jgi:hypothetical protein
MKRRCPHCKEKCIAPQDFKVGALHRCPRCQTGVEVGTFYTVALSLVLALFCAYFFSVDKPEAGFLLFALILFRAFYSKAVDALFLPLTKSVDK